MLHRGLDQRHDQLVPLNESGSRASCSTAAWINGTISSSH